MDDAPLRPSFAQAWIADLQEDVDRYGATKLVPWIAIISLCVGVCVNAIVSKSAFWDRPEIACLFFTAILTINGLLLALSWGSFAKIYEIASKPQLSQYLRKNKLLQGYTFHVDFIHYTQVLALSWSGIALILCVSTDLPTVVTKWISLQTLQEIGLIGCISSTIYALRYALGAVRMMQDLVWYSAYLPAAGFEQEITVHEGGRGAKGSETR
jgi:hypothetical protein